MTLEISGSALEPEVQKVLNDLVVAYNNARDQMHQIMGKNSWCLAATEAITLLKQLTANHRHSLVLSREDIIPGFWNNIRAREYLEHLKSPANVRIIQTRVKVFNADRDEYLSVEEKELYAADEQIHGTRGGLYYVENTPLKKFFPNLLKARYGLTVFQSAAWPDIAPLFIAVPFPALTLYNIAKGWANPLDMLAEAGRYDPSADMQMVVIFDKPLVNQIANELFRLIQQHSKPWSHLPSQIIIKGETNDG